VAPDNSRRRPRCDVLPTSVSRPAMRLRSPMPGHSGVDLPSPAAGGGMPANSLVSGGRGYLCRARRTCAGKPSATNPTPATPSRSFTCGPRWLAVAFLTQFINRHCLQALTSDPRTLLFAAARCPASRLSGRPPVLLVLLPLSQQEQQQHSTRVDAFKRARAASRPS